MMPYIDYEEQYTFDEIINNATQFLSGFNEFNAGYVDISTASLTLIYKLLSARYGRSHVASCCYDKFSDKLYSLVLQYGPTWEKNMEIQKTLRSLTDTEIMAGSVQVNDHAWNPSTVPEGPNEEGEEISTVNEQTKSKWKKSKLEGYGTLASLLEKDVTEEFLGKFKKLFVLVLEPTIKYPRIELDDTEEENQ